MNKLQKILTDEEIKLLETVEPISIFEPVFTSDEKHWFEEIAWKVINAVKNGTI